MDQFHGTEKWLGEKSVGLVCFALLGVLFFMPNDGEARERESRIRDSRGWDSGRHLGEKKRTEVRRYHEPRYSESSAELNDLYLTLERIERINYSRWPARIKEQKIAQIVHQTRDRLRRIPVRDYQTHYEFKMALRKIDRVNCVGRPGYTKHRRIAKIISQTRERLTRMQGHRHPTRRAHRMTSGRAVSLR